MKLLLTIVIILMHIFQSSIAVKRRNAADTADIALGAISQIAFKNCAPFEKCSTEIDGTLVDEANFINIVMPMYNLIKHSDNYSDTSGSLWSFKIDDIVNNADVTNDDNARSFKYKAVILVIQKKNSCNTKTFKSFLEIIRNGID